MSNKQTAVEWLVLQFGFQGRNNQEILYVKQIVEQAKAMEKEQIKDAFNTGYSYDLFNGGGEQYYNETYNKQDNDKI